MVPDIKRQVTTKGKGMSDIIDKANELADLHLEAALANARLTGNERLTGWCQNTGCGEPTRGAYCSKECREDAVKRERMGQ